MKKVLISLAVVAAFVGGYGYGRWYGKSSTAAPPKKGERKILYWHDPMHPAYKSDKPGIAPDCGMKLEPVYADEAPAAGAEERKVLYYRDPKDPDYRADKPGFNPETGSELEPVHADASSMPPGSVQITPERQQIIGVRYGQAELTSGAQSVRAVGKVVMDETRVHHVHVRTDGWIEKVFVNFTGDVVKAGQPMLTLYSPELLASQQEYLLALKARDLLKNSSASGVAGNNDAMVDAARRRLQLWDLSEGQIEQMERTGKPHTSVTLYADAGGYVLTRNAFAHQKVTPETELYTLADLSRVWVLANVFEYEAPQMRIGQHAKITLASQPGGAYHARVSYIQPQIDAQTRTLQVRLELDNPGLALKPEMYVDVELSGAQAARLTVPAEAVLDSGLRKIVFVDLGSGWFEPRQVETGQQIGDRVEILKGLKAAERIVVSGNFLLSSESQLREASSGMGAPPAAGQRAEKPTPSGAHQHD